mgnify:CR=1 FL=1
MGCHADSRSVTFGHVRCANMRLIVRICISQRIVMSGFCRWYGKDMEDVTEHEQEQCEENGQDCRECPDLVIKEQEAAGHERYNTDS